jgi:hypothetical protein
MLAEFREGLIKDTASLESLIETTDDRQLLADIHARDLEVESPKEHIIACLKTLYRNHLLAEKQDLEQKITNADSHDTQIEWMRQVKELRTALTQPIEIEL